MFFSQLVTEQDESLSLTEQKGIPTLARQLNLILNISVMEFKQREQFVQRRKGGICSRVHFFHKSPTDSLCKSLPQKMHGMWMLCLCPFFLFGLTLFTTGIKVPHYAILKDSNFVYMWLFTFVQAQKILLSFSCIAESSFECLKYRILLYRVIIEFCLF